MESCQDTGIGNRLGTHLRPPYLRWVVAVLVTGIIVAAGIWGVHAWRHRFVRENRDLFKFLPSQQGTLLFVDFRTLRAAGFLDQLVPRNGVDRDPDYDQFVHETGFDYSRDIDALAAELGTVPNPTPASPTKPEANSGTVPNPQSAELGTVPVFVLRGRFDWGRLRAYAVQHKGSCQGDFCSVASKNRPVTFWPIQPDVLKLVLGTVPKNSPNGAEKLGTVPNPGTNPAIEKSGTVPDTAEPVWLKLAPEVLANPSDLPLPLRMFAISIASASPVILSAAPASAASNAAFVLRLRATCQNPAAADTIRTQLEIQTKMVALELAREHQKPDPSNLTGLLTAGRFEVAGRTVLGTWPVRRELLETLR